MEIDVFTIIDLKVDSSWRTPLQVAPVAGKCPGFLKGGSNISWLPKKMSSDFKRGGGGVNDLIGGEGGSSTLVSLGQQILHILMLKNELPCTLNLLYQ